ncbi:MAG: topoisomerase C-terminal repeat-containing protein [Pirellulales bacterium]
MREPLKVLGESPVTKQPVKLFEGRYGPYVTDGTTNASLPKDTGIEDATLEMALPLLAARAAAGPSVKKKRPAKKAAGGAKKGKKKKGAEE